jgi:hypothetical protein
MAKDYKPGCNCADCNATREAVRRDEQKAHDCGCDLKRAVAGVATRVVIASLFGVVAS